MSFTNVLPVPVRWSFAARIASALILLTALGTAPPALAEVVTSAVSGNWNDPATWVGGTIPTSTSDVTIGATHTITILGGYTHWANSITLQGTATVNSGVNITSGGSLYVTGAFTVPSQAVMAAAGLWVNGGTATIGTWSSTGSGINCSWLNILGGSVSLGTATFAGDATTNCIDVAAGANLSIGGDFPAGAKLTANTGSTVTFNGASPQNIGGPYSFSNLQILNSIGVTAQESINVAGTLQLDGPLFTGPLPKMITLAATASVSGSSVIIGPTAHTFDSAAYFTFPVGIGPWEHMPVTVAPTAATFPVTVNVIPSSGGHPYALADRSLGGFWTIQHVGALTASYTFNYSGVPVNGNQVDYVLASTTGGAWSTHGPANAGTGAVSGSTASADWAIGEPAAFTCGPPQISVSETEVCPGTAGHIATASSVSATSWTWGITGGTITAGNGTRSITYSVDSAASQVVLSLTTNGTCGPQSASIIVPTFATIYIQDLGAEPYALFLGHEYTATTPVVGMAANASRRIVSHAAVGTWTIAGGTITGFPDPYSVSFIPNAATVTLTYDLATTPCGIPMQGTRSWSAVPLPVITAPAAVCPATTGHPASVAPVTGATYAWTISGGTILSGAGTPTITFEPTLPSGDVFLEVDVCTRIDGALVSHHAFIGEDATITAPSSVCQNATGLSASVPAKAGATYRWSISGGTITSATDTNAITFTAGNFPFVDLYVQVNGCATSFNSTSIETTPVTTIAVSANPVCAPATGVTASVPEQAGATYVWTINGGTITAGAGTPAITFDVSAGVKEVVLGVTVTAGSCAAATGTLNVLTPGSILVSGQPNCSVYGNRPYTASVPPSGSAPTYAWTISGGTFTGPTNAREVSFTSGNPGGEIVLSVAVTGSDCGTINSTRSFTILPDPVITAPGGVCPGSSGHVASVPALPDGTYSWSIWGGEITAGQGTNSITFRPTEPSGTVELNVSISSPCTGGAFASKRVYIGADGTISAPASFCRNVTGQVATVPYVSGQTYAWGITGGTITSGANTNTITFNVGDAPNVGLYVHIDGGCAPTQGWLDIETLPHTRIGYSNEGLCPATTDHSAWVTPDATSTYNWTISGGSITAGQSTSAITYSIDAGAPSVTLGVTTTTTGGCGTATSSIVVPMIGTIWLDDPSKTSCTIFGGSVYTVRTTWDPAATYAWTISGGTIQGSSTTNELQFLSETSGSVVVGVTVSGTTCGPRTGSLTLPIIAAPVITAPSALCPGATGQTASVTPVSGATYQWSLAGATIATGQGTASITFNVDAGATFIDLSVDITPTCGYTLRWSKNVPIGANTMITAPQRVCKGSGPFTASVEQQGGATYLWTITDGTIVGSATGSTVTFNSGTTPWTNLHVAITTGCGTYHGYRSVETSPPVAIVADNIVCANTTNIASVGLEPSTTYTWTVSGGSIVSGANTNQLTYSVGSTGPVDLTVTASNSCGTSTNTWHVLVGAFTINSPDRVCSSGTYHAYAPGAAGANFSWTLTNATLTNGSLTNSWIDFTPGASGSVGLSVTISNLSCGSLTSSKTLPIDPPGETIAITTAPAVMCAGATVTATATDFVGATYEWSVSNGTIVSGQGTKTITFTAGPQGGVGLYVGVQRGCGYIAANAVVEINAITTITAPQTVCMSSTGNTASVPAQAGATYTWNVYGGTLTSGQGTPSITFTAGTGAAVNLNVTVTTACGSAQGGWQVVTSPPVLVNTPWFVCAGSTGNVASVPLLSGTTYSWTISGGTIDSGATTNQITFSAGSTGPLVLNVTSSNATCGTNTNSVSISVGTIAIQAPDRICSTSSNVGVSVPWINGATYAWTISGGTLTGPTNGGYVTFNPSGTAPVTVGVTITGPSCGPLIATKTIPVDTALSPPSLNPPANVCPGASVTISATPAVTGATYNWNIGNATITAGQGTPSVTFTAGTGGVINVDCYVANACNSAHQYATIPIGPDATITAPARVCINSTGNIASVPSQAGATYTWSVNGGSVTAGQGTPSITFSVTSVWSASISVTVTTACGSNSRSRTVQTDPPAFISTPGLVCANSTGNVASADLVSGTTYNWTITGGTITSGNGTNQITYDVGTTTPVQLSLTSTSSCGSQSNTLAIDVGTPLIRTNPTSYCSGATNIFAFAPWVQGATYAWTITGGTISGPTNGPSIQFTPTAASVTLDLAMSGPSCGPWTISKTIVIDSPLPTVTVTGPISVCPNASATVTATPIAGATYQWSVGPGTVTAGQGTNEVTFTAPASGQVYASVVVSNGCGSRNASTYVPVGANANITAAGPICINSTGNTASVIAQSGATYNWSIPSGGTITGGQGTNTITYTAGTMPGVQVNVTVTTACGSRSGGYLVYTSPATRITSPWLACPNSTGLIANVPLETGTTYSWSITNGTITAGQGTNEITYSVGASPSSTVTVTSTNSCGTNTSSLPTAVGVSSVIAPTSICSNQTNVGARTETSPGATYAWTITGGTITSSTTTSNISFTPSAGATSVTLTVVTSGISCGPLTATKTIAVHTAGLGLNITASTICSLTPQTATATSYAGTTYSWTATNATIDSGQGTNSINYTPLAMTQPVILGVSVSTACGNLSTTYYAYPTSAPGGSISSAPNTCANSTGNTARITVQAAETISWSITNGTITAGQGTNQITYTAGASGTIVITATKTNTCSLSSNITRTVLIDAPPTVSIGGTVAVCAGGTGSSTASVQPPGATYAWTITNGAFTSATDVPTVTWTAAGASGDVTLTLTVTTCANSVMTYRSVPINPPVDPVIQNYYGTVCPNGTADAQLNMANIPPGATIQWSITNGTIISSTTNQYIQYIAGASGDVGLSVTVTSCGTPVTKTLTVPVSAAPDIHFGGSYSMCPNSTGNTQYLAGFFSPSSTITWSITNGTITAGQGTEQITFTAGASGDVTIGVTVTSCGTTVSSSINHPIGETTDIRISAPPNVCPGSTMNTVAVTADPSATYLWTITNGTITSPANFPRIEFTAGASGTVELKLVATLCGGYAVTNTRSIPIGTTEGIGIGGWDGVCPGQVSSSSLSIPPGSTVEWSITNGTITSGKTGASVTYTAGTSGDVVLSANVMSCNGPVAVSKTIPIGGTPKSTIWVSTDGYSAARPVTTACAGQLLVAGSGNYASALSATSYGAAKYTWTVTNGTLLDNYNDPLIGFRVGTSGVTRLTVTVETCGGTSTSTYDIPIVSTTVPVTASTSVCEGGSGSASVPSVAGATYTWTVYNATLLSGQGTPAITYTPLSATSPVSVVVTQSSGGCPSTGSASINVTPKPAVTPTTSTLNVCTGGTLNLTAPTISGGTYSWTGPNGFTSTLQNPSITNVSSLHAGTYTASAVSGACSWIIATATVTIGTTATPSASSNTPVCTGGTISLSVTGDPNATYLWTGPNGFTSTLQNPVIANASAAHAGMYSVVVTSGTCSASASTVVAISATPSTAISVPTSVCALTRVTASVPEVAGATYAWSATNATIQSGDGTSTITFLAGDVTPVILSVTVTSGNCSATASVSTPVEVPPTITISGPTSVCPGGSVSLSAPAGFASYRWSTGDTTQSITVSPTDSTLYTLTATTASGCTTTATKTVALSAQPIITIQAPATTCAGATANVASVAAQPGATYQWTITNGRIVSGDGTASITFETPTLGEVTLGVTVRAGDCPSTGTAAISVTNPPVITISGPDAVCPGGSATLAVPDGFASYLWSTGATTSSITVSPTEATTYSVTVRTTEGCTASAEKSVGVSAAPSVTIAAPARACSGTSAQASVPAQSGATYQWTIAGGTITDGASTPAVTFTAGTTGDVVLRVTISGVGCTASGSATIPISPTPTATITGPSSICTGSSFTLEGPAGFASYRWSTGETTRSITRTIDATTTFQLTVTNTEGCSATTEKTVRLAAAAIATITAADSVTANSTSNRASVPSQLNATYVWGITGGTITSGLGTNAILFTAAASGTVKLTVDVNAGGCTASGSKEITIAEVNADLSITKSGPATVQTGATYDYTLAVTNGGPVAATTVTVTDDLPPGVVLQSMTSTGGWTCTATALTVVCTRSSVPKGDSSTITLVVKAPSQTGIVTNVVNIRSLSPDPEMGNNLARLTTTVEAPPVVCTKVVPTLSSPTNGATNLTSPVTLAWTAVETATGYEVWLGSGNALPSIATTTTTALTATVSVPDGVSTWFVVARLPGTCGTTRSLPSSFTVAPIDTCAQNPRPQLTAPVANEKKPEKVTFTWNAATGASGYKVVVQYEGAAPQDVGTTTTETTLSVKLQPGTLTARVEAAFGGCSNTSSDAVTFTVEAPDPCANRMTPTLTAPGNKTTVSTASVQFTWTVTDNATEYRVVQFKLDESGQNTAEELEIGRTSGTTLSANMQPGTITWWVEALFKGCPSTKSAPFVFTIPPAHVCPTAAATLVSPANKETVTNASVTFRWDPKSGAIGYELWAVYAGGAPTLLNSTDAKSLTVTRNSTAGATEWFVKTLYDRCDPVESEHYSFTYEPPPDCSGAKATILSTPGDNDRVTSPVTFAWKSVTGATRYELYVQSAGTGDPTLLYSGATPPPAPLPIPVGSYNWYVQAFFDRCGNKRTTPSRLTVIEPPPSCQPLGVPTITAPAEISSGLQLSIRWSEVPGATAYVVQSADDSQFTNAAIATLDAAMTFYSLAPENAGATPIAKYVRVRATDSKCTPAQIGLFSNPAVIYVLPKVTNDATVPASEAATLTYQVPLGPELAGLTFTATPTQTWLSVTPTSGTVPVGGMYLTVTAQAADLPNGTSMGGITITLTDAGAGNVAGQGTTTYTTPVSVTLVSPVTPTAKTSPPPDALIIPAVAHAAGINSQFQSDVRVTNTSADTMKYQLSFVPSGEAGMTAGMQTTMDVEPGATVALDDVLKTWFSSGTQSVTGTLEIRPLTQTKVNAAAAGLLQNLLTFASSRTFNLTSNGTFGQYIPAIPFAKFIGKVGADAGVLSLQQIAQSDKFRTNLGFVEGSGEPASLMVSVFGKGSSKLIEFPVELKGGQHLQLNSVLAQKGVMVEDGRVEVKVLSSTGKVTAYASVLDNKTSDPLLVSPQAIASTGLTSWVIPGIADLQNSAANWKSDVRLFNGGSSRVNASLRFYSQRGGTPQTAALTLDPGEVKVLDSVLTSLFNAPGDGGALHVVTQTAARLTATARTYNQTTNGTYGQFIPAVTQAEAAALGTRALQILQVEQSDRFRTNVGLAEISGNSVEVEVTAVVPGMKVSPVVKVLLAGNEFRQLNSLLSAMGLGETFNARVSVRAIDGNGKVAAYGSVIDARTQDPTYIPAQ